MELTYILHFFCLNMVMPKSRLEKMYLNGDDKFIIWRRMCLSKMKRFVHIGVVLVIQTLMLKLQSRIV